MGTGNVDYGSNMIEVLLSEKKVTPQQNQIVISRNNDGWNDFGHRIKANFAINFVIKGEPVIYDGNLYVGFTQEEKLSKELIDKPLIRSQELDFRDWSYTYVKQGSTIETIDIPAFFTMLPNMQSYRMIVKVFGADVAKLLLEAINDLVVRKKSVKYEAWLKKAIITETFTLGFMRASESFFAFHNAESILDGLDRESFNAISSILDLSFKLDGFTNEHRLGLKYSNDSIIPKRINVLIGENGLGKSQCLNRFCRAVLRYKRPDAKIVDSGSNIHKGRVMINRLLAIGTPGETANTFPYERPKSDKVYYRRLHLTRNCRAKRSRSIADLLVQLARSEELIGDMERWELFLRSVSDVLDLTRLYIQMTDGSYFKVMKIFDRPSEQKSLENWSKVAPRAEPLVMYNGEYFPLSSGQLTFFKFALLCAFYIENGSFVLMDEPETHLHPTLISQFVDLLDGILEKTGSYALIATHSAFFVREVSREQVHVFKLEENRAISIVKPRLRTFGSDVDSISQFVFNEDIENRLTAKIYNRVKGLNFTEIEKNLSPEISLAALMDLKTRMETDEENKPS